MNKILSQNIYTSCIALIMLCLLSAGCTKKFDEINTDPTTFSSLTQSTIPNAFAKAEYQGIYGDPGIYQLARNLFVDLWSQYYATIDPGVSPDRYVQRKDWEFYQWLSMYSSAYPTLKQVIEATENTDLPANAVAKVWKVYIFHSTTDFYGPVPYLEAGNGQFNIPYDAQEDIYYDMFKVLDTAVAALQAADQTTKPYGDNDLIFHGDIPKWIKFANTLRLRLALRISFVDAAKAKEEAEKAVAAGVMTSNDDNAMMDVSTASPNGLNLMSPWGGFRMSASMESYLKGFSDPRLPVYFSPAPDDSAYHGIRNGLSVSQLTGADPGGAGDNLSNIGPDWSADLSATNKLTVMYAAEAYFLRAEGAVNGWDMGATAKDLYEQGIRLSLAQWGVGSAAIEKYIQSTSLPAAPGDYLSSPAVSDIPVKFSDNTETQRQQIATQKWLALFPDGIEAWAEVRRTGYPVLYPVVNSDNPDVPASEMIKRFTFIDLEYESNNQAVQNALPLLNGPDKNNTPVWWDVK
ncbi:SusD/RagB family nutrient-binding outer membrane lipoprotein [Parafilimonas sp.]|uniref:SusD/RagB family nutrient-binding outer membrane lipoprotein n=1 Tax=Parafilimonas sp. TaxID=1969739 RepID=UPI0039E51B2E